MCEHERPLSCGCIYAFGLLSGLFIGLFPGVPFGDAPLPGVAFFGDGVPGALAGLFFGRPLPDFVGEPTGGVGNLVVAAFLAVSFFFAATAALGFETLGGMANLHTKYTISQSPSSLTVWNRTEREKPIVRMRLIVETEEQNRTEREKPILRNRGTERNTERETNFANAINSGNRGT